MGDQPTQAPDQRAVQYFAYPDLRFDRLREEFPDGRYGAGADHEAEKQALLLSEPEAFFTTSTYDWSPLVMVRLEAIDITRRREWSRTSGSSRMNICIDPEPALHICSCSCDSEFPHLSAC